ncbi:MAG: hypothetical protein USCGTAYLOR_01310 [Chromatiales bacterium USCg_Taylor]|nr:MAG: hypothetical protein USCGTAYLOR_01310 [Chromatiales bacterium USCg_Taylor]
MPFIRNGGLFIPTTKAYGLGDEVFMILNLLDGKERLPVAGRVVWITPASAQGNRTAGIGVQISDADKGATRNKIETLLATALKSDAYDVVVTRTNFGIPGNGPVLQWWPAPPICEKSTVGLFDE